MVTHIFSQETPSNTATPRSPASATCSGFAMANFSRFVGEGDVDGLVANVHPNI